MFKARILAGLHFPPRHPTSHCTATFKTTHQRSQCPDSINDIIRLNNCSHGSSTRQNRSTNNYSLPPEALLQKWWIPQVSLSLARASSQDSPKYQTDLTNSTHNQNSLLTSKYTRGHHARSANFLTCSLPRFLPYCPTQQSARVFHSASSSPTRVILAPIPPDLDDT